MAFLGQQMDLHVIHYLHLLVGSFPPLSHMVTNSYDSVLCMEVLQLFQHHNRPIEVFPPSNHQLCL